MANLSLYEPLGNRFNVRLNKLFNDFFLQPEILEEQDRLRIKLDVSEDGKNYLVRADLPGVKKEDIHVDINGNQVSISAEINQTKEQKETNWLCTERYQGKLFRSFTLDSEVAAVEAQAKYNDGVLNLILPKKATGSSKRLAVQ